MTTRKTIKPKRCLKFEGYIFLPTKNASRKELRYQASHISGRLRVYDEYGNKIGLKDYAFTNIGDAINFIEKVRSKMILRRVKK